jgi:hypothetical protein
MNTASHSEGPVSAPPGLVWAALVEVLLGAFSLFGGVVHLLFGVGGLVTVSGKDVNLGNLAAVLGDVLTAAGLVLVVGGFGLWRRTGWAWSVSVGVLTVGVVVSIAALAIGSIAALPALVVTIVLMAYLCTRRVRTYFASLASRPAV